MCAGPKDMDDVKMKFGSLEEQMQEEDSVYHYYKRAIWLRNQYAAIRKGTVKNLEALATDTVAAFEKSYGEETLTVFCNMSSENAVIDLSGYEGKQKEMEAGLYVGEDEAVYEEEVLQLPAYGIVLMK